MARSSLTLDLKAHTGRALNEFKAFSDSLEKKFFVSGLKIDLLKNTLSEINREFDKLVRPFPLHYKDLIIKYSKN